MTAENPCLRNQNSTRREPWITRGPPPTTPAVVPTAVAVALHTVAVILQSHLVHSDIGPIAQEVFPQSDPPTTITLQVPEAGPTYFCIVHGN